MYIFDAVTAGLLSPWPTSAVPELRYSINLLKPNDIYIQGVTGGTGQTSGECSLC